MLQVTNRKKIGPASQYPHSVVNKAPIESTGLPVQKAYNLQSFWFDWQTLPDVNDFWLINHAEIYNIKQRFEIERFIVAISISEARNLTIH